MRQSQIFFDTKKEFPKDEQSVNAKLLTKASFIYKNSAGIYSYLPLGLRVIEKISKIVREEMNKIGAQEILMSALHDKHYLEVTGRWNVDVLYKVITDKDKEPSFNISWTHEEIIAEIARQYINSYNDLPFYVYQIQTKFRSEKRAKSGILRTREFLMKDLYSFHESTDDLMIFYRKVANAYKKIFNRCDLKTIYTVALGGDFTSDNTHEFQVVSEAGEDIIFICKNCGYAENSEVGNIKKNGKCIKCGGQVEEKKSIEVGNIFPLGDRYSRSFDLKFVNKKGERQYVIMGSYGIGITRVMGTIAEVHHDDYGIIWPFNVAPFLIHLIPIEIKNKKIKILAEKIYNSLQKRGTEILYDDRLNRTPGEKLIDSDLIGIPQRLVVSEKLLKLKKVEIRDRKSRKIKLIKIKDVEKIF
jgi:prolyl-tRNA synthetase